MSILRSTPDHTPIKYRCPNYCRGGIWHFYLTIKMYGMGSSTMTSTGALSLGNKTCKFGMRDGMVRPSNFVGISILIGFKEAHSHLQFMTMPWPDHYVCNANISPCHGYSSTQFLSQYYCCSLGLVPITACGRAPRIHYLVHNIVILCPVSFVHNQGKLEPHLRRF